MPANNAKKTLDGRLSPVSTPTPKPRAANCTQDPKLDLPAKDKVETKTRSCWHDEPSTTMPETSNGNPVEPESCQIEPGFLKTENRQERDDNLAVAGSNTSSASDDGEYGIIKVCRDDMPSVMMPGTFYEGVPTTFKFPKRRRQQTTPTARKRNDLNEQKDGISFAPNIQRQQQRRPVRDKEGTSTKVDWGALTSPPPTIKPSAKPTVPNDPFVDPAGSIPGSPTPFVLKCLAAEHDAQEIANRTPMERYLADIGLGSDQPFLRRKGIDPLQFSAGRSELRRSRSGPSFVFAAYKELGVALAVDEDVQRMRAEGFFDVDGVIK